MLDVDMNVTGETTKPVENIFWPTGRTPPAGRYRVAVRNYGYHERARAPTQFQIEIKNGLHYSHFEGVVSGTGRGSEVEVATFEYLGGQAQKEKSLIYQLAESHRRMGITTTTIGVGVDFDLELMQTLAQEGGGSSRFISDREEMVKLFDTEFTRMVALVAADLDMSLEFAPGVEVLETWGYQNRIEGNRIHYRLAGLHMGDYETILVRYRIPDRPAILGKMHLASFRVNANNLLGRPMPALQQSVSVALSENAADGISSGMVLHSGTMLYFARALQEIGSRYYANGDTNANLETALRLTRAARFELENASLRLDNPSVFNDELEILARYDEILSGEWASASGSRAETYVSFGADSGGSRLVSSGIGNSVPPANAANIELLQNRLDALYREIGLSFIDGRHIAALAPFSIRGTEDETPLLAFINESAIVSLVQTPGLSLVERSRLDAVRAEQNLLRQGLMDTDAAIGLGRLLGAQYMITGQVIPMSAQAIIFARVIHVETGEILSAAQVFVENALLEGLL
jgi:TolB-like protein